LRRCNFKKKYISKLEKEKIPQSEKPTFELKDLATAEEYLEWKKTVPSGVRRVVESAMKGGELRPSETGLALSDQFLNVLGESLAQNVSANFSGADLRVANLLAPLEHIETQSGYLNVFETLGNPDASWNLKRKIFET